MVYEFLKKQQEELIAKKIELDEDYELVLSKIKENEKYSRTYKYEEIKEKGYDKSKIGESLNKIYLRIGESDG